MVGCNLAHIVDHMHRENTVPLFFNNLLILHQEPSVNGQCRGKVILTLFSYKVGEIQKL